MMTGMLPLHTCTLLQTKSESLLQRRAAQTTVMCQAGQHNRHAQHLLPACTHTSPQSTAAMALHCRCPVECQWTENCSCSRQHKVAGHPGAHHTTAQHSTPHHSTPQHSTPVMTGVLHDRGAVQSAVTHTVPTLRRGQEHWPWPTHTYCRPTLRFLPAHTTHKKSLCTTLQHTVTCSSTQLAAWHHSHSAWHGTAGGGHAHVAQQVGDSWQRCWLSA
jgi:hypothetical protein